MSSKYSAVIIHILLAFTICCIQVGPIDIGDSNRVCPERENEQRWHSQSVTFSMTHNDVIDDQVALQALKNAAATWNAEGLGPHISVRDTIWNEDADISFDTSNLVVFFNNNDWIGEPIQAGLAFAYASPSARIIAADIGINAVDWKWSTDDGGETLKSDLETVLVHELGHVLGIGHLDNEEATMFPSSLVGSTDGRTLHVDDKNALACIYENVVLR